MKTDVDLGFAEKVDKPWRLMSIFFPSKIGNRPAWLSLKGVPSLDDLLCKCGKSCTFLLQVSDIRLFIY